MNIKTNINTEQYKFLKGQGKYSIDANHWAFKIFYRYPAELVREVYEYIKRLESINYKECLPEQEVVNPNGYRQLMGEDITYGLNEVRQHFGQQSDDYYVIFYIMIIAMHLNHNLDKFQLYFCIDSPVNRFDPNIGRYAQLFGQIQKDHFGIKDPYLIIQPDYKKLTHLQEQTITILKKRLNLKNVKMARPMIFDRDFIHVIVNPQTEAVNAQIEDFNLCIKDLARMSNTKYQQQQQQKKFRPSYVMNSFEQSKLQELADLDDGKLLDYDVFQLQLMFGVQDGLKRVILMDKFIIDFEVISGDEKEVLFKNGQYNDDGASLDIQGNAVYLKDRNLTWMEAYNLIRNGYILINEKLVNIVQPHQLDQLFIRNGILDYLMPDRNLSLGGEGFNYLQRLITTEFPIHQQVFMKEEILIIKKLYGDFVEQDHLNKNARGCLDEVYTLKMNSYRASKRGDLLKGSGLLMKYIKYCNGQCRLNKYVIGRGRDSCVCFNTPHFKKIREEEEDQ